MNPGNDKDDGGRVSAQPASSLTRMWRPAALFPERAILRASFRIPRMAKHGAKGKDPP